MAQKIPKAFPLIEIIVNFLGFFFFTIETDSNFLFSLLCETSSKDLQNFIE